MGKIWRFLICEEGPTAVEYAVLLALLVGTMVSAIQGFGQAFYEMQQETTNALSDSLN